MAKTRKLNNEKRKNRMRKTRNHLVFSSSDRHFIIARFCVFSFLFSYFRALAFREKLHMRIQQFSILCRNDTVYGLLKQCSLIEFKPPMNSSTNFQAPPQAAYFLWYCDKVYHKQEVCFLLSFLWSDCQLTI